MDKKISLRAKIQSFGGFLTAMVIPNIGAFMLGDLLPLFLFQQVGCLTNN